MESFPIYQYFPFKNCKEEDDETDEEILRPHMRILYGGNKGNTIISKLKSNLAIPNIIAEFQSKL